jgi:hypothetical protein
VRVDALGEEYVHLVTWSRREDARQFESIEGSVEFYRGTTGRIRDDGNPDRPLTSYSVEFETWEVLSYSR